MVAVRESDDRVIDIGWRLDTNLDDTVGVAAWQGVEEPPQVQGGGGILIEDARLGGGSASLRHQECLLSCLRLSVICHTLPDALSRRRDQHAPCAVAPTLYDHS